MVCMCSAMRAPSARTTRADSLTDSATCSICSEARCAVVIPAADRLFDDSEMPAVSPAWELTCISVPVSSSISLAVARAASRCRFEPASTRLALAISCCEALPTSSELNNALPMMVAKLPIKRLNSAATSATRFPSSSVLSVLADDHCGSRQAEDGMQAAGGIPFVSQVRAAGGQQRTHETQSGAQVGAGCKLEGRCSARRDCG